MKKLLIFACSVSLIVFARPTHIQADDVALDGSFWTALTDSQQVVVVEGLLTGYEEGYNNGFIRAVHKDQDNYHATRNTYQMNHDPESVVSFGKTFGYYQQGITDFYSRYPKSITVTVGNVLSCLADDPQFTCEEVSKFGSQ